MTFTEILDEYKRIITMIIHGIWCEFSTLKCLLVEKKVPKADAPDMGLK
jgi:hypothetical protein